MFVYDCASCVALIMRGASYFVLLGRSPSPRCRDIMSLHLRLGPASFSRRKKIHAGHWVPRAALSHNVASSGVGMGSGQALLFSSFLSFAWRARDQTSRATPSWSADLSVIKNMMAVDRLVDFDVFVSSPDLKVGGLHWLTLRFMSVVVFYFFGGCISISISQTVTIIVNLLFFCSPVVQCRVRLSFPLSISFIL